MIIPDASRILGISWIVKAICYVYPYELDFNAFSIALSKALLVVVAPDIAYDYFNMESGK